MIKEIAFNVYAVSNIKRSREFYEGVLGLVPDAEYKDSKSWVEYSVGGGTFTIGASDQWKPSEDGASVAFEVDNFEEITKKIKDSGVSFVLEPSEFPTCQMAVVSDPDKNKVIIHKRKEK